MLRMLTLREPSADVRERFLSGELDEEEQLRNPLLVRWERALAHGLSLERSPDATGVSALQLSERRERLASLLRGQGSLLEPLVKDFAAGSLVAVLADRDGVVLHRHAGRGAVHRAELSELTEGAIWHESTRGTNAIGTSLAERRPVAVLGGAHFDPASSRIFCYASPVFDAHGELVCVLNVSGPMAVHDAAIGSAVRATAAGIEQFLRAQVFDSALVGGLATLSRLIEHVPEPAFLVDCQGQLLCRNRAAGEVLCDLGERESSAQLSRQLPAWRDAALRQGKVVAHGRTQAHTLKLDSIRTSDGRVVALLAIASVPQMPSVSASAGTAPRGRRENDSVVHDAFAAVLGTDRRLEEEKARARVYARTELPVLLLAETGTGKELFARAIHAQSARSAGPFVPINCGAMPLALLESELFGHAPHAFTGASQRGTDGKIAAANGGTLFLDEIGDMPTALQALLLRFLDDGTYYRVGDAQPRKADVRIVCATCRDLPGRVTAGEFRQDLFFRIQGACVSPPPLRERSDRVWLAENLLAAQSPAAQLKHSARDFILQHAWPGNVRELKSALIQAHALAQGTAIGREHFSHPLLGLPADKQRGRGHTFAPSTDVRPRQLLLRDAVDEALRLTNGNLSEAARRLNMARSTLYRILQRDQQTGKATLDYPE